MARGAAGNTGHGETLLHFVPNPGMGSRRRCGERFALCLPLFSVQIKYNDSFCRLKTATLAIVHHQYPIVRAFWADRRARRTAQPGVARRAARL